MKIEWFLKNTLGVYFIENRLGWHEMAACFKVKGLLFWMKNEIDFFFYHRIAVVFLSVCFLIIKKKKRKKIWKMLFLDDNTDNADKFAAAQAKYT